MPQISVAMPVYNDELYVREAINSILNQTFNDFELLIINDGSTDKTPEILDSFEDKRIRIIHFEQNQGRPFARNKALDEALGKYLIWMDGDDISQLNRLELQAKFMDNHEDIAVLGGYMQCFGQSNHLVRVKTPHEAIQAGIIWYSSTLNGTNCLRLESIRKCGLRFHEDLLRVEDYAFLGELLLSNSLRSANIPEILLHCRYFLRPTTPIYHVKACKYILQALGLAHNETACLKHSILSLGRHAELPVVETEDILNWANLVFETVLKLPRFNIEQFLRVTHAKIEAFLKNEIEVQQALRHYASLPLSKTHNIKKLFKLYKK